MTKTKIARDFIGLHKEPNLDDWQPLRAMSDNKKLEIIYTNLVNGVYGTVHEIDGEYEIEISSHESKTGITTLFSWEREI